MTYTLICEYEQCNHQHGNDFASYDTSYSEEHFTSLKEALDACAHYGEDVVFEISPRNVTAENNKLVLLDCFFLASKNSETREAIQ